MDLIHKGDPVSDDHPPPALQSCEFFVMPKICLVLLNSSSFRVPLGGTTAPKFTCPLSLGPVGYPTAMQLSLFLKLSTRFGLDGYTLKIIVSTNITPTQMLNIAISADIFNSELYNYILCCIWEDKVTQRVLRLAAKLKQHYILIRIYAPTCYLSLFSFKNISANLL